MRSWHSSRTWFEWIIKKVLMFKSLLSLYKSKKSALSENTILVFGKMRINFICIFFASVQTTKNTQAHHKSGYGKYVADDVEKVSVRTISGPKIGPGSDQLMISYWSTDRLASLNTSVPSELFLRKSADWWTDARKYYQKKNV